MKVGVLASGFDDHDRIDGGLNARADALSYSVTQLLRTSAPWYLRFPVLTGHDPLHKLVEKRNSESRITMVWTPDHSLGD